MKSKKIALIGANGQLGNDLQRVLSEENAYTVFPLIHADIEISDPESIKNTLNNINPDIVVNTAAYNNVDESETNPEKAFLINAVANKHLAYYCKEKNSTLVSISSDYVFGVDGDRTTPYRESDCPGPVNAYGISKLAGEHFVRYGCTKHFIIRTCGLFGIESSSGKKTNFVESMLKASKEKNIIQVVDDQCISPTYTYNLAKQICRIIKTDAFGLYHAASEGSCSWYEFAKEIFALISKHVNLEAISSSKLKNPAKRPHYSVLENYNLKRLNINCMLDWKEGLKAYLQAKGLLYFPS